MDGLILVIDDSPTICKVIDTCLCREGYEVLSFSSGLDALRWLASPYARHPRLILLDIMLPYMDGYQVARYLKKQPHYAPIPIVIISRRDGILDLLKARLAGASDYLVKPFQIAELLAIVRKVAT
jgi:twitching motility two-component system response regulator PilG